MGPGMLSGFGFEEFFGRNSTFEDAESRSAFKETLVHMFPLHNDQERFVFSPGTDATRRTRRQLRPCFCAERRPPHRRPRSEMLLRRMLESSRATHGDRHPDTLTKITNLALLLKAQGKLDEAAALLREALDGSRETLGSRHPQTLDSITNLASLLQDQGELSDAAPLYWEVLEAFRATLGDRHTNTLDSINNLAELLEKQGKLDEAALLCREAVEGRRAILGDQHPDTITSITNLGLVLHAQGKLDEAAPLLQESLRRSRTKYASFPGSKTPGGAGIHAITHTSNEDRSKGTSRAEPTHRLARATKPEANPRPRTAGTCTR